MPVTPAGLTYSTTPVKSSFAGQVIENLDLWVGSGDAITITHDNVVVRNVIVHHATGNGIVVDDANNVTVSDSLIMNSDPPTGSGGETGNYDLAAIRVVGSPGFKADHVTMHDSELGIYVGDSPNSQLTYLEGYNFQGPYPAGQLVQFFNSANSSLSNFYTKNDAANSHVEDNVSVIDSQNVVISNGVIDGNNSPSGIGVMFEGNSQGGRVENVDAIHMGNGAFSSYSDGVTFVDTRSFDNIAADQGRGANMSNTLIWNVSGDNVSILDSTYTEAANPNNIVWEGVDAVAVDVTNDAGATPMTPFTNVFDWTTSGTSPVATPAPAPSPAPAPAPAPAPTPPPVVDTSPQPSPAPAPTPAPSPAPTPTPAPTVPSAPAAGTAGQDINGTSAADTLTGTSAGEDISGKGGNDKLLGLAGNDELFGDAGNDTIDGGAGTDFLFGGAGRDTFVFKAGNGADWVEDFETTGGSRDLVQLDKAMFANFAAVMSAAKDVGSDVWITHGTDQLILNDTAKAELQSGHFFFV